MVGRAVRDTLRRPCAKFRFYRPHRRRGGGLRRARATDLAGQGGDWSDPRQRGQSFGGAGMRRTGFVVAVLLLCGVPSHLLAEDTAPAFPPIDPPKTDAGPDGPDLAYG